MKKTVLFSLLFSLNCHMYAGGFGFLKKQAVSLLAIYAMMMQGANGLVGGGGTELTPTLYGLDADCLDSKVDWRLLRGELAQMKSQTYKACVPICTWHEDMFKGSFLLYPSSYRETPAVPVGNQLVQRVPSEEVYKMRTKKNDNYIYAVCEGSRGERESWVGKVKRLFKENRVGFWSVSTVDANEGILFSEEYKDAALDLEACNAVREDRAHLVVDFEGYERDISRSTPKEMKELLEEGEEEMCYNLAE